MTIEKELDKLEVSEQDIVIMKGDWFREEIQAFAKICQAKGLMNILVIIPDEKSLETMPTDDFYYLMKEVEKKRAKIGKAKDSIIDLSETTKG